MVWTHLCVVKCDRSLKHISTVQWRELSGGDLFSPLYWRFMLWVKDHFILSHILNFSTNLQTTRWHGKYTTEGLHNTSTQWVVGRFLCKHPHLASMAKILAEWATDDFRKKSLQSLLQSLNLHQSFKFCISVYFWNNDRECTVSSE